MRRSAINVEKLIPSYLVAVSDFNGRAPMKESSVIVDGPGLGCASHGLLLALLGFERISKLRAVHFFSSSGYAGFFFNAKQCQKLKIHRQDVADWNKHNQRRHHIKPFISALEFLGKKLFGKPWYFRNHLLADALRSTVSEEYANAPIRSPCMV